MAENLKIATHKTSSPETGALAPVVQMPVELEKLFVVLEHALPDRGQLERIARELFARYQRST